MKDVLLLKMGTLNNDLQFKNLSRVNVRKMYPKKGAYI